MMTNLLGLPEVIKGREDPVQGWVSYKYGMKEPAPMVRIPVKTAGAFAALTAIYPYPDQIVPEVRLERAATDGSWAAARVFRPNGSDLVIFSQKAGELYTWNGIETDAEAAVVRLDASGDPLSGFHFGGTCLHYLGKPVGCGDSKNQ